MSRWREIPKIDAHVHVVLHQREQAELSLNPPGAMLRTMDEQNVDRAIVLPINYPDYFPLDGDERADWLRANNERQAKIVGRSGERLIGFADCAIDGTYAQPRRGIGELQRAVSGLGLAGLKVHPHNLRASADDPRLLVWFDAAAELNVPVVVHSNPSGYAPDFYGSAPARIYRAILGRSGSFVIAHMGGVSHLETLAGGGYVDVSGTLLWLADLYGPPFCGRFLRRIGIDRLLFATDYPIYRYEAYYEVLDRLDFTDDEMEKIAHVNAERMLAGLPPAEAAESSTRGSSIG
jgi:predicted TIM-barrel fold metal-dependent hydrolase